MKKSRKIVAFMTAISAVFNIFPAMINSAYAVESSDWKEIYRDKLYELMESDWIVDDLLGYHGSRFDFYDLDQDGTPELFVTHDSHQQSGGMVYSILNGELIQTDVSIHSGSIMVNSDESMVFYNAGTSYMSVKKYYKFSDGVLTEITDSDMNFDSITWDSTGSKYSFKESSIEEALDAIVVETPTTTTTTSTTTTETATMPTTTVTVATSGGNLAGGGTGTALPNGTATAIGTGVIGTTTATRVYPSGTTTAINPSGNSSTTTALSGNAENSGTTVSGSSQPENNTNNNSSNSNSNSNSSSSDSTGKSSPKTSDAGVGIAVTGIAIATGMAFVARKKKD